MEFCGCWLDHRHFTINFGNLNCIYFPDKLTANQLSKYNYLDFQLT